MNGDTITMKIPTARQKLKNQFPKDPKSDIQIVFKGTRYELQKAYLRLQSVYFKKECTPTAQRIVINQDFQQDYFTKILSCFYGASVEVQRLDLLCYYPIIKYLQIECLLNFVRKDILSFIEHYDLFVVMAIAHQYSDQQMFEICLQQLERQNFEQLHYHQFQLLKTELPLFKLIIKTHNRYKACTGNGISFIQVDQILKDYCEGRGLTEQKYHQLKFQLIDKTSLTSQEYKKIFLDEVIKYKNKASLIMQQNQTSSNNSGLNRMLTNTLSESVVPPNAGNSINTYQTNTGFGGNFSTNQYSTGVSPNINIANELTLQMQNTFEKKRNEQLKNDNEYLSQQLDKLKKMTSANEDIHRQMEEELRNLKQQIKKRQLQEHQHKKLINKFQIIIRQMQEQLEEKNEIIDKLIDQVEQIKNRKVTEAPEEDQMIVESQFLPAHLIGQMMTYNNTEKSSNNNAKVSINKKPNNQTKNKQESILVAKNLEESLDQQELQALYLPRINFDEEPTSTPKKNLPKLAEFITDDGFNRKKLTLIFRRSKEHTPKGDQMDIRQRNSILVLIQTESGQNIGGYISVSIHKQEGDYLQDKNAFLFTLSKNQKFSVKKEQTAQAIFISPYYLISFANDLMIPTNCLQQPCYCSWPSSYQGSKQTKQRGFVWLVGGQQFNFKAKNVQVYEVKNQEMEMILD